MTAQIDRRASGRARAVRASVALVVMVALVGCGDSTDSEIDASTPASLAESIGCDDVSELDQMIAPIRGKGASSGLGCEIDGGTIHIFARAPIEDPSAVGWGQGGTVENIRRLLGGDAADPACELAGLITDDVFVVGTTADQLTALGVPGEEPIPVSPTVSYLDSCAIE
jgi:hypothetical protein